MCDHITHKSDMRKVFISFWDRLRQRLTLDFWQMPLLGLFILLLLLELGMLLNFY